MPLDFDGFDGGPAAPPRFDGDLTEGPKGRAALTARCVASQVRHQNERLDTVNRSGTPCPAFGAPMTHTG